MRRAFLLLPLVLAGCGNWSMLEMLGPQSGDAYLPFAAGNNWQFAATVTETPGATTNVTLRLTLVPHPLFPGLLGLSNHAWNDYGAEGALDNGHALAAAKYGVDWVFDPVRAIIPNGTGAIGYPGTVSLPFIRQPFVAGDLTVASATLTVSNFPLPALLPAAVSYVYTVSNRTEANNLTLLVGATEYEKVVKLQLALSVSVTCLEDDPPYVAGQVAAVSRIAYTMYLAPGVGILHLTQLRSGRNLQGQVSESWLDAALTGYAPGTP